LLRGCVGCFAAYFKRSLTAFVLVRKLLANKGSDDANVVS
jgi:hypothetical protein